MSDFVYDKYIIDHDYSRRQLKVSVTVVDAHPDSTVQINIESSRIRITHFLSMPNAMELARLLTNAVYAYDRAVAKASETIPD